MVARTDNVNLLGISMTQQYFKCQLAASFLFFFTAFSSADTSDNNSMENITLQDLLNLEVTVASSKAERISDTPAIVSSYSRDDMARLGLRNLKELLSFIPGFFVNDGFVANTYISIRGLHEDFNQKVLFLIDDVPHYITSHSQISFLGIPAEAIDHVEVIRGPGAVYYGSSASAGVVKVVTRKGEGSRVSVSVGSHGLRNTSGYVHYRFSDNHSFSISAEKQNDDGYDAEYRGFNSSTNTQLVVDQERIEKMQSILGRYQIAGFNLQAQVFESEKSGLIRIFPTQPMYLSKEGYFIYGDNHWTGEKYDATLYGDYSHVHWEWLTLNDFGPPGTNRIAKFSDNGSDNYRYRIGGRVNFQWSDNAGILVGAERELRSIGDLQNFDASTGEFNSDIIPATDRSENSFFAQVDISVEKWRVLLGGRYTDNDEYGGKLTPRAALVYKISDAQSIKILYAVGFNSPNFRQTDIALPNVLNGDKSLNPEVVSNFDVAYTWSEGGRFFVANIYRMNATDFIQRKNDADGNPNTSDGATFENGDDIDITGVEVDWQQAKANWRFLLNADYIYKEDSVSNRDAFNLKVPNYTISAGATYTLGGNILGFSVRHVGAMRHSVGTYSRVGSYTLLNMNYTLELFDRWELYATVKNLLDDDIRYPSLGLGQTSVIEVNTEGSSGRNIIVGARFSF